jgi:thiol-disulfide isomerase/thioredoxin
MKQVIKSLKSNIIFILLMVLVIITWLSPAVKVQFIRALMAVGAFKPDPEDYARHHEVFANLPDYRFKDTTGNIIALSDLKHKVVFINYWATWCPPCLAEMPSLNKLYAKLKNNPKVVFIMVDTDNNLPKSKAYFSNNSYNLPLYTSFNQLPDTLLDGTIPTTLIFGKDGSLKYKHTGAADYNSDKFLEFLEHEMN